jgi:hypothetical protein
MRNVSLRTVCLQAVVACAVNPSTWEAEAGGSLSLRPAWSTEWVQDSQGYTEKLCLEKPKKKKKKERFVYQCYTVILNYISFWNVCKRELGTSFMYLLCFIWRVVLIEISLKIMVWVCSGCWFEFYILIEKVKPKAKRKEEPSSIFQRQRVDALLIDLRQKFPPRFVQVTRMCCEFSFDVVLTHF